MKSVFSLLVSDDDDDEDDDVMDEDTAKALKGFIAEPGDEVMEIILSIHYFVMLWFIHRKRKTMSMNNLLRVNPTMTKKSMMMI